MPALRLGAVSFVCLSVPIWALAFTLPAPAVMAALFGSAFFGPLVNAPLIGVLTTRTPAALRAKVMTAVISVNTLAAPVGFLLAGQVLERWGVVPLFAAVVLGITWMAIVFAAITWRYSDGEPAAEAELAVT